MKLIEICKECGKPAEKFLELSDVIWLKCGHTRAKDAPVVNAEILDYSSANGKKTARPYQIEGIEFLAANNYCGLIGDSMGVGKTAQGLVAVRNNEKLLPCLVIVKSIVLFNWTRESYDWIGLDPLTCFTIQGKMPFIPKGFKFYIVSMDSLASNMDLSIKYEEGIEYKLKGPLFDLGIKSVIVDECHCFKNDGSKRTRALINFIKGAQIEHKIFLSGTPIKNRADEFFVTLNLVDPINFPSRARFRMQWLEKNEKGAWANLNPRRAERFHKMISKYYLRREKIQVLKNLPSFARFKSFIPIEDPAIKNSYNAQLGQFSFKMQTEKMNSISILGELAKLRRITGIAKIQAAIEWTEEFFEDCDLEKSIDAGYPDKLAIGIHHKDVRDALRYAFNARDVERANKFNCLTLSGEDSAWEKDQIVQKFSKPENRLLVVNELAGGVGINLQTCANTLVLERQWNAADEEQFESRFHRDGQTYPVTATYMMAQGTIDEFFDEMVEDKRKIFGETVSQNFSLTQDGDSLKQFAERVIGSPLR